MSMVGTVCIYDTVGVSNNMFNTLRTYFNSHLLVFSVHVNYDFVTFQLGRGGGIFYAEKEG